MKLPFEFTIKSILLEGKERELAKARYELTGEELDRKILELTNHPDSEGYALESLDIDYKYGHIDDFTYESKKLEITCKDLKELSLKKLELAKKLGQLSEFEYEKEKATLTDEPWVVVKDSKFEENDGKCGLMVELDWNDLFIEKLREEGYEGLDDVSLIKKWYAELCRVVALEEGLALDIFESKEEIKSIKVADGVTEYK